MEIMYPEPVRSEMYEDSGSETDNKEQENCVLLSIKEVLGKRFKKGFRLNSSNELKRFRKFYEEVSGKEFEYDE